MSESNIVEVKEKKPLFGKKERKLITDPLSDNNPITVQVLGICSALAVTTQLKPSVVMAISVVFVMVFSSLFTSLLRNAIPGRIRIIVELTIVSVMVTLVSLVLQAFAYDVSKQLSVFVGLIITNCIVMGRLEAFALANKPWPSVIDAFGNGLGYGAILIVVAFFRELFGAGKLFGFEILGSWYEPNGIMLVPAGALFVVGLYIWIERSINKNYEEA